MTALLALTLTLAQAETRNDIVEQMNRARTNYEYGEYAAAEKLLSALVEVGRFESESLAAEAWRLLGLSRFYLGRRPEAVNAFLEMLYIDPDAELDPFLVPPAAIAFFDKVKKDHEAQLAPVRERKRAELEARRKQAEEESERRRQAQLEEERKRLASLAQPSIERRVVQREFWVSLLPFGLGQIQNGDRSLGYTLATSEVIAGAMSAGSALLIEQLRDPSSGKFENKNAANYTLARDLNVVKWVSAAIFYALWAGGAVHAAVRFQPEQQLPDRLLQKEPKP
jgi:tetratricopeptide (TPR) repeat protein